MTSLGVVNFRYSAPDSGYKAPSSSYDAPSSSYEAPSSSYDAPSDSYDGPSSYEAPSYSTSGRDHTGLSNKVLGKSSLLNRPTL